MLTLCSRLLIFFCWIITLLGCVNYSGIKKNQFYLWETTDLLKPHHYSVPSSASSEPPITCWWSNFNNPQLNEFISIALHDSPTMHIVISRLRAAEEIALRTQALLWPSINLSGYRQRQRFSKTGLVPPPFNGLTFNIAELGLNFSYELDFWGKNRELLAAKISETCAAQADLKHASLILAAQVIQTYFTLQSRYAALQIAYDRLKQQQALLTIIQVRIKNHIESDIPLQTAITNLKSANLIILELQQIIKTLENQLAVLLGKNPINTSFNIKKLSFEQSAQKIPTYLPAHLLARRPDIIASRLRAEAAAHQINVAKAYFFPDINLTALFSYQSIYPSLLFKHYNQNNAGTVAIDLPIFDANARRAQLGLRYAEYDAAVSSYNQTLLIALEEVTNQLATMRLLQTQLKNQQQSLNAAQTSYNLLTIRFQHHIIDYEKLLSAQSNILDQKNNLIQLQNRYLQANTALFTALAGDF